MKNLKKILILALCSLCALPAFTQKRADINGVPIDFSLQLKNMHLWRGIQITNEVMSAVDLNVKTKNEMFAVGLWGGAGFTGEFKEFDYYASFQKSGFKFAVWDIYNFSKGANYNTSDAFNYRARETGHFVDISAGYTFQGKIPLSLNWATVVFGRDRGAQKTKNLYSTYVSADYPVLRHKVVNLDMGIAGAFALNPEKGTTANFYANHAGIVNVNVTASKDIKLGSYTLPVSVMAMWNPARREMNMQVALNVL